MIGLIDFDLVSFRCAATAENEEETIAHSRCSAFVEKLIHEAELTEIIGYVSGKNNFRYGIFPEYKASRKNKYRPKWEESCKEFLKREFTTYCFDEAEADDGLAILQTRYLEAGIDSIIVSIDKDMLQVPGWHYQWEQIKNGEVIRSARKLYVTPEEGIRNFYTQLIVGDHGDGIKGVVGCGKKAAQPLQDMKEEKEMFDYVRQLYGNDEEMLMNGQLLWLQRAPGKMWEMPYE